MKMRNARWLRSALCLMLAMILALGTCVTAFAEEVGGEAPAETKTINYVSLGDSMTNGYGLTGYNGNSGVADYGEGSYTNQFATWLVDNGYADEVNHFQLALSAMRAEDLHWLLEVDYDDPAVVDLIDEMDKQYSNRDSVINDAIADGRLDADYAAALRQESTKKAYFEAYADRWNEVFSNGDSWTWRELVHDYRFNVIACYVKYYEKNPDASADVTVPYEKQDGTPIYSDVEALQIVAKYFQENVANADIVSNGIGNGNFGVFILGRVEEAIGFGGKPVETMIYKVDRAIAECPAAVQTKILALKDAMYAALENYVAVEGNDMMEALINSMVYGGLSYVLNWCGSMDAIVKLNPDAEIITMGLMNTMNGIKMEVGGVTIDVGQCMNIMLGSLNAFMAAYPVTMQALGHYDDATFYYAEETQVECYADTYNDVIYKEDNVVRDRFVNSIVGEEGNELIWNSIRPIAKNMGTELQTVTLEQIQAYEAMTDVEKIGCANQNGAQAMSIALYLAAEKAVLQVLRDGGTMSADAAVKMGEGTLSTDSVVALFEEKLAEYTPANTQRVIDAIGENVFGSLGDSQQKMLVALFAMPDALGEALAEDEEIGGLLNLYAHCLLGNGLSGHPSQGGHDQLAAAVEEAYAEGYTSFDKTKDNVIVALNALYDILEQYGPEAMEYAYQYALENGYIDQLETALAELKAELEGQVGAYVDELVPAIESTIAALQGDAEELKAQLTALKTALDAKLAELEAQLEEAGEDASAAVEQAIAQTKAVIANLEAAIAEVESVLDEIGEAVTQLQAALEQIAGAVEDLSDAAVAIGESVEDMLAILASSADLTVEKAVAAVEAARAAVDAAVELLAGAEDALSGVIDQVSDVAGNAAEAMNSICENALTTLTALAETLTGITGEDIAAAVEALNAQAQAQIDAIKSELEAQINEAAGELNAQLAAKKAELEAIASDIANEIAAKQQELEAAASAQIAELQAQIDAKRAELEAAGEEAVAEIEAQIAELEAQVAAKQAELEAAIESAKGDIEGAYAEAKAAVEAEIASIEAQIAEATAALQAAADAKIAEINADLAEATAKLEAAAGEAAAMIEQIVGEAQTAVAETKAAAEAIYAEVTSTVEDLLADAEALANDVLVQVQEKIEEIVTAWNDAYGAATSSEYTVDDESYYVALGDDSAVSESYVDMLAKAINEEFGTTLAYNNLAKSGETVMTVGNTIAANAAEIVKADLITLGFSNATFANEVIENVLSKKTLDLDWSTLVTDEGVQYVEQALAQIRQLLIDNGISGTVQGYDMTQAVMTTIESYAFSCVAYACGLPELVNAIHEINPEALVIIVGQYNPFDGVTLSMDGADIELGEYIDYLVSAAAVHATAYCMLTGNAIYVDAPNAQVKNTDTEFDASDLISLALTNSAALYPSEAGHQYICNKILKALDIKTAEPAGLLGDVNGDGEVDIYDVQLLHKYVAKKVDATMLNLAVADVNSDGEVDIYDVQVLHKYVAKRIAELPYTD